MKMKREKKYKTCYYYCWCEKAHPDGALICWKELLVFDVSDGGLLEKELFIGSGME